MKCPKCKRTMPLHNGKYFCLFSDCDIYTIDEKTEEIIKWNSNL